MKINLDIKKSVEENAEEYFEKAKKSRKKLEGAKEALKMSYKRLHKVHQKEFELEEKALKKVRKREWFEKFHWCVSSDGFLMIGGNDATTNEIVVKKHSQKGDIIFHTDMAGSPFVVVKNEGKDISESAIQEAADFTAGYSKAWKKGLSTLEVFYVEPDQVSKEAEAGEYMPKGAFMIRGDTTYITPKMSLAVGIYEDKVMAGPIAAIKENCDKYVEVVQGDNKTSDVAKKIQHKIGGDLDDIIRALPAGGCDIKN